MKKKEEKKPDENNNKNGWGKKQEDADASLLLNAAFSLKINNQIMIRLKTGMQLINNPFIL